jgi:hypothetical protein
MGWENNVRKSFVLGHLSLNVIRMRWAVHVVHMGEREKLQTRFSVCKLEG